MKKTFLFLMIASSFAWAQSEEQTFNPETVQLSEEAYQIMALPKNCRRFSDFSCIGAPVYASCFKSTPGNQFGTCVPNDIPDQNGDVACRCM